MSLFSNLILFVTLAVTASCNGNTVLICKGNNSYAYHEHYCEGLNKCRAKVEQVSLSNAKSLGRTPCRYCYEDIAPTTSKQNVTPVQGSQCTAITKKGTRCSRSARSGGRCWQHGG